MQFELVLLPCCPADLDRRLREHLSRVVRDERYRHGQCGVRRGLREKRSRVARVRTHGDAPVAFVQNSRGAVCIRPGDFELGAVGEGRGWPFLRVDRDLRGGRSLLHQEPVEDAGPIGAERAVADQLRVKPAVIRVVDLFRHQTVERRTYSRFGLVHLDIEGGGCLGAQSEGAQ